LRLRAYRDYGRQQAEGARRRAARWDKESEVVVEDLVYVKGLEDG
jgi:hypothetical protein